MSNQEILTLMQRFCGDGRDDYSKPFRIDGYTIATNGSALVAANQVLTEHVSEIKPWPIIMQIKGLLEAGPALVELPALPAEKYKVVRHYEPCPECNGSGRVLWEYKNYKEEFDCPICKGTGVQWVGHKNEVEDAYVLINDQIFNLSLLHLIADLPGLMVLPSLAEGGQIRIALVFAWAFGFGAVLPMRQMDKSSAISVFDLRQGGAA